MKLTEGFDIFSNFVISHGNQTACVCVCAYFETI